MIDTVRFQIPFRVPKELNGLYAQFCRPNFDYLGQFEFFTYFPKLKSSYPHIYVKWGNDRELTYIEFSYPKQKFGSNVLMARPEGLNTFLIDLKLRLEFILNTPPSRLNGKNHSLSVVNLSEWDGGTYKLPPVDSWTLQRMDICWNWKFDKDDTAQAFLDGLRGFSSKRKKRGEMDTSFWDRGSDYTIKYYLKHPEYLQGDYKRLSTPEDYSEPEENKKNLQIVEYLKEYSNGILRFEVELRKKQVQAEFGKLPIWGIVREQLTEQRIKFLINKYHQKYIQGFKTQGMLKDQIIDILVEKYGNEMGINLFNFYLARRNKKYQKSIERTKRWRYNKMLKEAGIGVMVKKEVQHKYIDGEFGDGSLSGRTDDSQNSPVQ